LSSSFVSAVIFCPQLQLGTQDSASRAFFGAAVATGFALARFLKSSAKHPGASNGSDPINGGDPMMTEPDLVTIEYGAAVDDSSLVAHINTRGAFK
jgi:hypothetical protein